VTLFASFYLHFGISKPEPYGLFFLANIVWFFLIFINKNYNKIKIEYLEVILYKNIGVIVLHFSIMMTFIVLLKYNHISRLRIFYFYSLFFIFLTLSSYLMRFYLKEIRRLGFNARNILLVGSDQQILRIKDLLINDIAYGYNILGYFDDKQSVQEHENIKYLGPIDKIYSYLESVYINEIYISSHSNLSSSILDLIKVCENKMIRLKILPDFEQYTRSKKVTIDFYFNTPIITLRDEPLQNVANRFIKRFFDVAISFFAILFCLVLIFPWVALLIKLTSKGPFLYKQIRNGEDGKQFTCLKFRTMVYNHQSNVQATINDSRITRFGIFLRRTSIDELPQLFNVFFGQMSLVGPRPHPVFLNDQYNQVVEKYLVRHFCKPGITGWAQVSGYRGGTKDVILMEKRIEYDIWYIENWSFLLDIKILLKTFLLLIKGSPNAY